MGEEKISSSESEGAFNEFINEQLEEVIDHIINEGDVDMLGDSGSDIIVEMDDIQPPKFVYGDKGGGYGAAGQGPGNNSERIRFSLPFDKPDFPAIANWYDRIRGRPGYASQVMIPLT